MFLNVDDGRSWISVGSSEGATIDIFSIDGGRSWIFSTASQGARCRYFLPLMVGESLSPPPKGARHQNFLTLMMGTLGSPSASPTGPNVDVFSIDGGHFWISDTASLGGRCRRFLALMVYAPVSPSLPPRGLLSTSYN
jgi:hypothetical protein